MRKEYDFAKAVRNPHVAEYKRESNLIPLDLNVAKLFPDAESVNRVLRIVGNLLSSAPPAGRRTRKRKVV